MVQDSSKNIVTEINAIIINILAMYPPNILLLLFIPPLFTILFTDIFSRKRLKSIPDVPRSNPAAIEKVKPINTTEIRYAAKFKNNDLIKINNNSFFKSSFSKSVLRFIILPFLFTIIIITYFFLKINKFFSCIYFLLCSNYIFNNRNFH